MVTQIEETSRNVYVGVDTHKDTHTAAVVDVNGGVLKTFTVETTSPGFGSLTGQIAKFGRVESYGIEGTGSYGALLARYINAQSEVKVVEVNRVNRQDRRRYGKTDTADAVAAARAVASGKETNPAKKVEGDLEIIKMLQTARTADVKTRTQTVNRIKAILVTAPENISTLLDGLTTLKTVRTILKWRPVNYLGDPEQAVKHALKLLAKQWDTLNDQIVQTDRDLATLLNETAPWLMELQGVGTDVAAKLLITAGSNPERLKSEASFAALCGASPIDASSGKQQRHRLNQGGNRQANNALYTIAITRMAHDPETQKYVAKQKAKGKTRKEIIRQLKRYIARQTYKKIKQNLT
jgi:transposase